MSSGEFEVNVVDSGLKVMFVASVSYIYTSAFQREVKPFLVAIKKVEAGTGNEGKNLEYQCTYRGICIEYTKFRELMDQVYI